jgi:hypothetical protein
MKCDAVATDIYHHWTSLLTVPVLASPERYFFDRTELFDSEYHTNALGRRKRTRLVIEDLANYLDKEDSFKLRQ